MNRWNIRLLMGYTAAQCALPMVPVIVPFFENEVGLSFAEFLVIQAIFSATMVLMEVPSGWISDIWTRKGTLMLSSLLCALGLGLLGVAEGFMQAAAAEILVAIGLSLSSGTITALLYDDLLDQGREDDYRRLEGKRHGFGFYMVGASALVGGLLYELNPYLPMFISAGSYLLGIPCALLMKEPPRVKKAVERNPFYDVWQVMRYALRGHAEVAAIIFFVGVMFGGTQAGQWMQQPYYMELGIAEVWFGVLVSIGFLIGGLGGQLGHVLERYIRPMHILIGLWGLTILCWVISGSVIWYHALPLLLISNAAYGVGMPVLQDALNKRVDSARRATVLSVASLMIRLVFIPLGFIVGWVVEHYDLQAGLLALAGIVFFANILNLRKIRF
jgi:hypothetical protein